MSATREQLRDMSFTIDNLMDLGKKTEAEQLLKNALQASLHDNAYHLFFQAEAALYIGKDHRQREYLLNEGLKVGPEDAFLMRNLGGGYLMDKRYSKARHYFRRALELEPKNPDTLRSIGLLYSAKGREGRAINWFLRALDVKTDDHDSLRQIGVCHAKLGNDLEAIDWYKKALVCCSNDYDAMRQMGVSFAMLGDYETALVWLNRALKIHPNDLDSKRNLRLTKQKKSGIGTTFVDRILVRIARKLTLAWRRLVDRIDQMFEEQFL